jgi:GxxExxY protein
MNVNEHELIATVVGAAYDVANTLGCGFLEKVYGRALIRELTLRGCTVEAQHSYDVTYQGERIGEYFADIIIEGRLVIELKCAEAFSNQHLAQCLNYLKVSGLRTALLIDFQHPKVEWRRVVSRF